LPHGPDFPGAPWDALPFQRATNRPGRTWAKRTNPRWKQNRARLTAEATARRRVVGIAHENIPGQMILTGLIAAPQKSQYKNQVPKIPILTVEKMRKTSLSCSPFCNPRPIWLNNTLGRKMKEERAVPISKWPKPEAGAPCPLTLADESSLFVRYYTQAGKVAVIHFPMCSIFAFGSPNDEAMHGHPLYSRGLTHYSIHLVENSSWIDLLEHRNSVHSRHDRERFLEDKNHYIFTFHDSTLECVVTEGKFWPAELQEFETEEDATNFIRKKNGA
jgi:hypothetical protein